ncbi:hypothetical protein ZWY2020_004263 [Hordeum vulgare]|nr:hypothetical protein ZWY2020_004263 [Hordeum vulgare]
MARDLAATDPLAPFLRAVFVSMSRRLLRRGTPKTPTPPPEAELRLLPACSHTFHAVCVDAWLRTTPTCLLYRAIVAPPHPSIAALLAVEQPPPEPAAARSRDCSGGSASRWAPFAAAAGRRPLPPASALGRADR